MGETRQGRFDGRGKQTKAEIASECKEGRGGRTLDIYCEGALAETRKRGKTSLEKSKDMVMVYTLVRRGLKRNQYGAQRKLGGNVMKKKANRLPVQPLS